MPFVAAGQYDNGDGFCCDPTSTGYADDQDFCIFEPAESPIDGLVCDANCPEGVSAGCTSIPLDGGLGLLALAGGGLATAAMRRRREEEAAEQV